MRQRIEEASFSPGSTPFTRACIDFDPLKMSIGIPIKLLHEAEGHIITLETTVGEVYRGKLLEAEDNMNCQMVNVTLTARDGRVTQVEQIFIRGSMIRFFILPDMLKNAPMFKVKPGGRSAAVKPPMHIGGGRGGK